MSDIKEDLKDKFSIQLILSKLESDGENMATFRMLDYEEIAEELSNSKKSQIHS